MSNPNISFWGSCGNSLSLPWYHKRKIDPEPGECEVPPAKMLITEEKMVNQLKGIHLSQEYTSHDNNPGPSTTEIDMDDPLSVLSERTCILPTLVMSEEIRELQKVVDSPLPKHLLSNFNRPTTALVLWKPPVGDLSKYLMNIRDGPNQDQQSPSDMEQDDDNNNQSSNRNPPFIRTV